MHTRTRIALTAAAVVVTGAATAAPASAATGDYELFVQGLYTDGRPGQLPYEGNLLRGDVPLFCDVDSDPSDPATSGRDDDRPITWNAGRWTLSDDDGARVVRFGRATDVPLCGNWDTSNDGGGARDEIAVRRGNEYFLAGGNVDGGGRGTTSFHFGRSTDQALVGDWDGDGVDEIALRRGNVYFFASENVDGGGRVRTSAFGRATDLPAAGHFALDQDYDTIALRRGRKFFVSTDRPGGRLTADIVFDRGRPTDLPFGYGNDLSAVGLLRIEG